MSAVLAAMQAAARQQQEAAKRAQEAEDNDDDEIQTGGAAVHNGAGMHRPAPATGVGGDAGALEGLDDAEDEEMRAHLPMQFGKLQERDSTSLEAQHAAFARPDASVKLTGAKAKKKLSIAPKLGVGLNVPAATPTMVALQQQKAAAAAAASAAPAAKGEPSAASTSRKALPAHLPSRPAASTGAQQQVSVDDDGEGEEVGPPLPPGMLAGINSPEVGPPLPPSMATGQHDGDVEVGPPLPPSMLAGGGDDVEVGPPLPPSALAGGDDVEVGPPLPPTMVMGDEQDAEVGPPLPPGMVAAAQREAEVGPSLPPANGRAQSSTAGAYDPSDLSQQVFDDDDDEEDEDEDDGSLRLPVSHQVALAAHAKTVTCLALDRGGGRLVSGSSDHDIYFWDFAGMTKELRPFRHVQEPLGQVELRSIDYNPSCDRLVVAGSNNQPGVLDRDGRKLGTLMKGDMYIRDMRHTKGHVAACTSARWHVHDNGTFATCGEDGTVRLWDVEVALERGDDAVSLNVQGGQKGVCVVKDQRGIKSGVTCAAWRPDGDSLLCGAKDGSLQLWEFRASEYKPVVLLPRGTPKSEFKSEQIRPARVTRGAHAAGSDVSCVRWNSQGTAFASRSTDGTLKVWDIRRFDSPLAEWGDLPCVSPMSGCDFSPDQSLLVAGTGVKKGEGSPELAFFSLKSMQRVAQLELEGSAVVPIIWHPRLNQILLGNNNGRAYVLYDPTMSEKGVMFSNVKAAPKRAALSYTGGAMHIITPHALPMFREDNEDHRKKRRLDRKDPLKSRLPEQVFSGPGTGGKLNRSYQQALLASLHGGISGLGGTKDKIEMFQNEDPREELLKYAKMAEENPVFVTPAYAVNQPATLKGQHLAQTVESDEEADEAS